MTSSLELSATGSLEAAEGAIREAIWDATKANASSLERRAKTVLDDVVLLARCAATMCLVTYTDAIALRGHGNPQNGKWLDEVFAYAIKPFGFPDLTMLVVNKATKQPSPDAFEARRSILSKIHVDDVSAEQRRCVWFSGYEAVLGPMEPIPSKYQLVRLLTPQPAKEREIARAVSNAIGRVARGGIEQTRIGKEYPESLSRAELTTVVALLWDQQRGCCRLTGQPFELRTDVEAGNQEDRVSLDRIDNRLGYTATNIQLVTQFANRARGALSVEEARKRLVQFVRKQDTSES